MTTPKLCIDCKWSRRNRFFKLLKTLWCAHPNVVDRVSGKAVTACHEQRMHPYGFSDNERCLTCGSRIITHNACGPDGKLFEPKETK